MTWAAAGVVLAGVGLAFLVLGALALVPAQIRGVYVGGDALATGKAVALTEYGGEVHVVAVMKDKRGFVSLFYPSRLADGVRYVSSRRDYVAEFINESAAAKILLHVQPCTNDTILIAEMVRELYQRYGADPRVGIIVDLEYVFVPARVAAEALWGLPGLVGYTYLYRAPHLYSYDGIYPYGEGPFEILFVAARRGMDVPWHFFPQYDKTYNKLLAAAWAGEDVVYDYAAALYPYQSWPTRVFYATLLLTPGALLFYAGRRLSANNDTTTV